MGLLSFLLLFKDARAEPDSTDSSYLRSFEERGLCTAQEATVLRRVSVKSAIPWVWALDLIARALENGTIPATLRFDLQGCCMRGRTAVQHTLTYVQTPLPLMYVHLVVLLVKATSVVWSFFVGANLAHVSDRCAIAQYAYVCVWIGLTQRCLLPPPQQTYNVCMCRLATLPIWMLVLVMSRIWRLRKLLFPLSTSLRWRCTGWEVVEPHLYCCQCGCCNVHVAFLTTFVSFFASWFVFVLCRNYVIRFYPHLRGSQKRRIIQHCARNAKTFTWLQILLNDRYYICALCTCELWAINKF